MMTIIFITSCASQPGIIYEYNPKNLPIEELVTLYIEPEITVKRINDKDVNWSGVSYRKKIVNIPSGINALLATFQSGSIFTLSPSIVLGEFEQGNTYLLKSSYIKNKTGNPIGVKYHFFLYNDKKEGEEIIFDINKLMDSYSNVNHRYIKYILNPRMDDIGNTVKLENDEYILIYKPDLEYALTDKETGITSVGRTGFHLNSQMTEGKTFLFETDISAMSAENFLESDYTENSQIILIPVECSETEVTYGFQKPLELLGKTMTFSITEIKK
jgi:hypothetical protein